MSRRIYFGVAAAIVILGGAYTGTSDSRAIAQCAESHNCFEQLVLERIRERDLTSGFVMLRKMYATTSEFRPQCHQFVINLTEHLYEKYPDHTQPALTPVVAWCNYGFLQQYPKSILLATNDVSDAVDFCAYVKSAIGHETPGAEAECYRGIGRGLPFMDVVHDGSAEERAIYAVDVCNKFSQGDNRTTCLSGVFNSIGIATRESQFVVDANDPLHLCTVQIDALARTICLSNYKPITIDLDPRSPELSTMLHAYETTASTSLQYPIFTFGYLWGTRKVTTGASIDDAISACAQFSDDLVHYCVQGVSIGIAKHGYPDAQYKMLTVFCDAARSHLVIDFRDCPSQQTIDYLRGIYSAALFERAFEYMRTQLTDIVEHSTPPRFGA